METKRQDRDWKALGEALGVFSLIMLYIWFIRLYSPWIAAPVLGFVISTHFVHGEGARWLGFGWKNFRAAFRAVMPWVAGVSLALLGAGILFGTARPATLKQAGLGILGYVLWGMFQQYLLNGYFVNRFAEFEGKQTNTVALAAAAVFALVHLPNWFLMAVTFAGGYICARVYLRYRSLYVLALAHGMVGFFLFFAVPDWISAHFLVGPRYVIQEYGTYPELLL
ncbi:MAG: type II CAAX prenyl endopeptidase Rce1 family protein [Acidobacteriota bacterium]